MSHLRQKEIRVMKWYFGGFSSAAAACITHPLDLIKVHLQTHKGQASLLGITKSIIKNQGFLGFYNGISASLLRQLTYSMTRFGIYEIGKQSIKPKDGTVIPAYQLVSLAGVSGAIGGLVGNPADLVNVRMQNDMKLPLHKRRNYQHALHGLYQVASKEGVASLWRGSIINCPRSALMTIGQMAFYDEIKPFLISTSYFDDSISTHVTSSLIAGLVATGMCQPVDVLKTRYMNAKPGKYRSILHLIKSTMKEGPLAFYKGIVPAVMRIAPHTVLLFVFLEQLRINFGKITY